MAKYQREILRGDFDDILNALHQAVLGGSFSASYEDGSDWEDGPLRCAVRVYERYSWTGGNRVSLTLTLAGRPGKYFLSAITAGGSTGTFFKFNTLGEEAFLDTISQALESL